MSPAWSGRPDRCEYMSPTVTILLTAGSFSANQGSLSTIVDPNGLDIDASWNTVSGSTPLPGEVPLRTSFTPNPLAYMVFPPCTTATAMPGSPECFIRSSAIPSSLATASSTALSGKGIAGTRGGYTSDSSLVWPEGAACFGSSAVSHPDISADTAARTTSDRTSFVSLTPAR